MRMYFDALMDRPVTEEHYISPGSFEFNFNGKNIRFDFFESCGGKDEISKNANAVTFELRDLDTTSFPEAEAMCNIENLKNIKKIEEFYMYTGECDEPEINLEKILSICFSQDGIDYYVPDNVIEEYNLQLVGELQKKSKAELEERE